MKELSLPALRTVAAIAAYIAAITAANLLVAERGPSISVLNAFLLIGLDLSLRDYLHDTWQRRRAAKMLALIASAGLISYALNPAAGRIAVASCIAFTIAASVDWLVYAYLHRLPWHERSNTSNIAGAGVDSFLFPAIAFGWPFLWLVMLGQFTAKVAGGLVWSLVLGRIRRREAQTA